MCEYIYIYKYIEHTFDIKHSLFVFVACERCNGLGLSETHRVVPAVAWAKFSIHIFFCFSFNVVIYDKVSALIVSFRFLVFSKDIIGLLLNVLANFLFIFKVDQCYLMIWETFGTDCCKIFSQVYNWHCCYFGILEKVFLSGYYLPAQLFLLCQ